MIDRFRKVRKAPDQMEQVILIMAYEKGSVPHMQSRWEMVRDRCKRKGYIYDNGWLSAKGRLALHHSGLRPFKEFTF